MIYDLELVDHLDALGLDVQWISEDNELVSSDGRIGDIAEGEDRIVSITAVLTYRELSAERTYQIRVCGREETGREKALKDIREGIREIQAGSGDSSEVALLVPTDRADFAAFLAGLRTYAPITLDFSKEADYIPESCDHNGHHHG